MSQRKGDRKIGIASGVLGVGSDYLVGSAQVCGGVLESDLDSEV